MKAAILVDNWKLPIFRRILDEEGYEYEYEQFSKLSKGSSFIKVTTDDLSKLKPIVERMNMEAAKSRDN